MSDQQYTSVTTASARNLISPSLQFTSYMSLPMPVIGNNRLFLAFLVGRGEALNPELGYQIWPPSLLALFETERGQLHELRTITPNYFSIDHPPDHPMGKGVSPPEKSTTEYLQNELHLFQSCDTLLIAIAGKHTHQDELHRFDELYKSLTEEALLPYCQRLRLSKVE
ncbi:MAG: hypothetical protein ABW104_11400 [Candidatus Thiodiazotropha sp. 6PLUC2]